MKFLLAIFLFCVVAVYATSNVNDFWFRVANHIGTETPAALRVKTCGLGRFYVNKKDNSRFGFGYDIAPVVNPYVNGLCTGGCGSSKRDSEFLARLDEKGENDMDVANALFASDSYINFDLYWGIDNNGDFTDDDRIMTRITNGDIAYVLSADASLLLDNGDQNNFINVTVPGSSSVVPIRQYPSANFQFNDDNHLITQNWKLELAYPAETCSINAPVNNEIVSLYAAQGITAENYADWSFKTRVRMEFIQNSAFIDGLVTVVAEYDATTGNFVKRIRGTAGASFAPLWIDAISMRLTATSGDTTLVLIDDDANGESGPSSTYIQSCSPADLSSIALKKKFSIPTPLAH